MEVKIFEISSSVGNPAKSLSGKFNALFTTNGLTTYCVFSIVNKNDLESFDADMVVQISWSRLIFKWVSDVIAGLTKECSFKNRIQGLNFSIEQISGL